MEVPIHERMQILFENVYPAGRGPYSYREVADAISTPDAPISRLQVTRLVTGDTKHPSFSAVARIADFFNVPLDYFWTQDPDVWDAYIEFIEKLRDKADSTTLAAARRLRELAARRGRRHRT